MKRFILFSCIALIGTTWQSCTTARINKVKKRLDVIQEFKANEDNRLVNLSAHSNANLASNSIDSNTNALLLKRVNKYQYRFDSVAQEIRRIDTLMKSRKAFRKAYKKSILPSLAKMDSLYQNNKGRLSIYLMLDDVLNTNSMQLFDLAAFFGSGKYNIPVEQEVAAIQSFGPILDSLQKFSNKYKDIKRTATIVILGYADGQGINTDSELCDTLIAKIGNPMAGKSEMNLKLSELRALELIRLLTQIFIEKKSTFATPDQLNINYVGQGKGEKLPMNSIHDYREDDERRRIVMCYWSVLPDID
jgi:outer membrane protein OmpA-like peptidoglycan-associated protein